MTFSSAKKDVPNTVQNVRDRESFRTIEKQWMEITCIGTQVSACNMIGCIYKQTSIPTQIFYSKNNTIALILLL